MRPWEHPVPPILYKYLRPERLDVLIDCQIRFSQRKAFDDDHELQPDYATFGTEGEIWEMLMYYEMLRPNTEPIALGMPLYKFVELAAKDPRIQQRMKRVALSAMQSPDQMGVLCLTTSDESSRMWDEYAGGNTGFVVAFHTGHAGFNSLRTPGKLGKVEYSDVPFGSYLGAAFDSGAATFYRKRMKYAFEQEWRSIRLLQRLKRDARDMYFAPFDPAAVSQIIITENCSAEKELRDLVRTDERYRHVGIIV